MIIENRSIKYNPIYKKIYHLHKSIMDRCYLKSSGSYGNYGNKGVTVDKSWHDLNSFIETIDSVEGFDLDRILNGELELDKDIKNKGNKVYSKDNCMFVTKSDNCGNRPSNICEFVAISEDYRISYHSNREKFCRDNNLDSSTVWKMLNRDKISEKQKKKGIPIFYKGWQFFYQNNFNENMIQKKRIIRATNIDSKETKDFHEIKKFAEENNVNSSSISACLRGAQNRAGRWKFKIIQKGVS